MAGNYFIGSDGHRRDFDAAGRELGSQDGSTAAAAPFRRTLPNPGIPRPDSQATQAQPGVIRSLPPPAASASPRPVAANIQRPDAQATQADTRTNYGTPSLARPTLGTQPSAPPGFSRPQPGQQQPSMSLARPTANPVTMATGVPFDEMVRRAENAMSSYRIRSPAANTRSAMQRHYDAAAGMHDFWLNQAASIGPNAQARFLQGQQLQSQEAQANANNAAAFQRTLATNDARLQAEQMQQQGATGRAQMDIAAQLQRPQAPIQLGDGTLAQLGPDGQLVPYQLPDGTPARGSNSQVDQSALARLTTDLMPQFLGADEYGLLPDASVREGVRPPTQEERLAAFRQASSAARETLSGSTAADPQRQQQTSTRPTSSRPASQEAFLERARAANPGYSDAELIAFYAQTYGNR